MKIIDCEDGEIFEERTEEQLKERWFQISRRYV